LLDRKGKIFIAGHNGMVGSSLVTAFSTGGFSQIVTARRSDLDLTDPVAVTSFFQKHKPDYVVLSAAKVGGIQANINAPVEFLLENLKIQNNVIMASFESGVRKFCFLGSSCIYPKDSPQPMKEEYLLTGPLEPTNEGYSLAKIAGLRLVQYLNTQYGFCGINPMPCNLYGKNDSFDPTHSHVLSAMVKKFSDAVEGGLDEVSMWGTGIARREFMNVQDLADAILFLMDNYELSEIINVGWGQDVSISELATIVAEEAGFRGNILWDSSKPDGMLRKCLDVRRITDLGFRPQINLRNGIKAMFEEYGHFKKGRGKQ